MAVAAMGIIYNENTGLLLEKRTDTGEWCTPGGALEPHESIEDALRREIKEETNLDFNDPKLFDIKANVHMIYPNGDEVYYTDIIYEINDFYGELKIVDVNIRRLRMKIENDPTIPAYITTVWGYGYKWGF